MTLDRHSCWSAGEIRGRSSEEGLLLLAKPKAGRGLLRREAADAVDDLVTSQAPIQILEDPLDSNYCGHGVTNWYEFARTIIEEGSDRSLRRREL